ncbi:predicted protein [Pyrenophora tritici-repentis Pt-1C-BFP]|uniref:Uncharacterized protein n=2 Tax=Pyrenophora tritici-repentis TaxID=45151 RepID=B2WNM8_PYRTR|nr:uncharacterized protein PTRG_11588 [Pyrenophora tritici-repentis Pt-1C-BFP]EDU44638.1 predicted protein [Pyrenophora tritici-repentis Pt-1C-BFP]
MFLGKLQGGVANPKEGGAKGDRDNYYNSAERKESMMNNCNFQHYLRQVLMYQSRCKTRNTLIQIISKTKRIHDSLGNIDPRFPPYAVVF